MKYKELVIGFVAGAVIFSSFGAIAAGITAVPNPFRVMIMDKRGEYASDVDIEGYNINNNTYFKLRDIGAKTDFEVGFDEGAKTIIIKSDAAKPAPVPKPEPEKPTSDLPEYAKTKDGVGMKHFGDGVYYVERSGVEAKLKANGFNYLILDDGRVLNAASGNGEMVFEKVIFRANDANSIPLDYYYSTLLPWIKSL